VRKEVTRSIDRAAALTTRDSMISSRSGPFHNSRLRMGTRPFDWRFSSVGKVYIAVTYSRESSDCGLGKRIPAPPSPATIACRWLILLVGGRAPPNSAATIAAHLSHAAESLGNRRVADVPPRATLCSCSYLFLPEMYIYIYIYISKGGTLMSDRESIVFNTLRCRSVFFSRRAVLELVPFRVCIQRWRAR